MSFEGDTNEIITQMWYTPGETRGVGVLVATATLSLISVVALLIVMAVSAYQAIRTPEKNQFVRTHVAAYFVSLLLCDFAQGLGGLLNLQWIGQGGVNIGGFCTAQAVIKQTGNVGTALWSFVIAVHTFNLLFLRWHIPDYVCYGTLVMIWSFLGFVVILGPAAIEDPRRGPFWGVSGYWCWITPQYPTERFTLEYMIMFLSAGLSFLLYSLVFLRLRGNVTVSGWVIRFHRTRNAGGVSSSNNLGVTSDNSKRDNHVMNVARQMIWYPVSYTILILPIAAARFSAFAGNDVPFAATIFCGSIFMLSGFVNAVLFTTTRRVFQWTSLIPASLRRKLGWGPGAEYGGTASSGSSDYGGESGQQTITGSTAHLDVTPYEKRPFTPSINNRGPSPTSYGTGNNSPAPSWDATRTYYNGPSPSPQPQITTGARARAAGFERPFAPHKHSGSSGSVRSNGSSDAGSTTTLHQPRVEARDPASYVGVPIIPTRSREGSQSGRMIAPIPHVSGAGTGAPWSPGTESNSARSMFSETSAQTFGGGGHDRERALPPPPPSEVGTVDPSSASIPGTPRRGPATRF